MRPEKKEHNEREFQAAPAGLHLAILYRIVGMGTQKIMKNGIPDEQEQVMFLWELPDSLTQEGKPLVAHDVYNYSAHEKSKLYKHVKSWKGLDVGKVDMEKVLLGQPANLTIVHNPNLQYPGKFWVNIHAVSPLMTGQIVPQQVNPSLFLDLRDFDQSVFDSLSDRTQAKISLSPEFQALVKSGIARWNADTSMAPPNTQPTKLPTPSEQYGAAQGSKKQEEQPPNYFDEIPF